MINLDADCVLEAVNEALSNGESATEVILGPMSDAMQEIGRLYEEGEYFIAELIEAAEIFKSVMDKLDPRLKEETKKFGGAVRRRLRIVLGTVKGDVHDIGKTIVRVMLQAAGHEVLDLGVDVPPEKFIDAIKELNADVLGMSALLTTTARRMKEVIEALEKEGLRDKVFVVVGGAATDEEFARKISADAWGKNAVETVRIVNDYAERRKQ